MVRKEDGCRVAVEHLQAEAERLEDRERDLVSERTTGEPLRRAMNPAWSFHLQLRDEVEACERLRRRESEPVENSGAFGQLLSLRIYRGVSRRERAGRPGVHESQVSRGGHNGYPDVTVGRAGRMLETLGADVSSTVRVKARGPVGGDEPSRCEGPVEAIGPDPAPVVPPRACRQPRSGRSGSL